MLPTRSKQPSDAPSITPTASRVIIEELSDLDYELDSLVISASSNQAIVEQPSDSKEDEKSENTEAQSASSKEKIPSPKETPKPNPSAFFSQSTSSLDFKITSVDDVAKIEKFKQLLLAEAEKTTSPLFRAVFDRDEATCRQLLKDWSEKSINIILALDSYGNNPLHLIAVRNPDNAEDRKKDEIIARVLSSRGVGGSIKNRFGLDPRDTLLLCNKNVRLAHPFSLHESRMTTELGNELYTRGFISFPRKKEFNKTEDSKTPRM